MRRILLVGATGMVGQCVLEQALADARVARVIAPTRRKLPAHPKLENPLLDFDALPEDADWWAVDGVICTLGTTLGKAGSKDAFRKVDFHYPLAVARLARKRGAEAFALTSAMGADPRSWLFYNRTKGEVESAIEGVHYPSLVLVRPGLLRGKREEFRCFEGLAGLLLGMLGPIIPRRYRPVDARKVARALLEGVLNLTPGCRTIESAEIQKFG